LSLILIIFSDLGARLTPCHEFKMAGELRSPAILLLRGIDRYR
jgi:hypothetical protein